MVAAIGPDLGAPAINRRDVVLVAGPWLAGVTSVAVALRERISQYPVVESPELGPGDAPLAVVFVVSASAPMTGSDCTLLDAAAENTDMVVGVVTKIDVHLTWRDVLDANRARLAEHAPRYGKVPWLGVAAAPEVGEPQVDALVATVQAQLADSDLARRNRLRAWEARLQKAAGRFDRDADGAGRRARVEALREERSAALRQRRQSRTERTVTMRGQIQQARVQLSYFARNRCASVRSELQEDIATLTRRRIPAFEEYVRQRLDDVVNEVVAGNDAHLADVAQVTGVSMELPPLGKLPAVAVPPPPLKSRRLETRLLMVVGAVFGLGVALTLSRVVAGLLSRLHPGVAPPVVGVGIAACVALGLAMTLWLVNIRRLLSHRAVLDRWVGDVTSSLRSVTEQLVASRVLDAEAVLATAVSAHDETENVRVNDQINLIDAELREHTLAAARAAAVRDREMPTILAAIEAIRAELGEPGISSTATDPGIIRAKISSRSDAGRGDFLTG
ncbi:hypothetical protein A5636_07145 [Mycobacterium asiaticum]|uniref:Uncharacterized protein n=1 Tax=Mycobacterium asiaticum TaxID=1790 RepID=A0A1A3N1D2_MYCAS|nr:hypothetical protein [Mycobacterium asiaticum]OBK14864.1 hypothetical protein A5636_07145 [Mycobacterium asiaticum]